MEHTDLELYIQIRDGQPYEHPIFADNFRAAFPGVDTNNLPNTFAKFIRVDQPTITPLQVYEGVSYEWVGDVVKDVHKVRELEGAEREAKVEEMRTRILNDYAVLIQTIEKRLTEEMSEAEHALWQDCLVAYQAWQLEQVYPMAPIFPRFPRKNEDGIWVAPAS